MPAAVTLAVRRASESDVDPLLELVQYAYRGGKSNKSWTGEEHLVKGPRVTRDQLIAKITREGNAVLICESVEKGGNPRIVGCLHIEKDSVQPGGDVAHIGMLAVDPDQQSGGVGSRLMRSMENYARKNLGAGRLEGEVISGRPELMGWYARMGYHATGETKPFLGPESGVTPLVEGLHFVSIAKTI